MPGSRPCELCVSVLSGFLPQINSPVWIDQIWVKPVWCVICLPGIGCWPPVLNRGQDRLLLPPHCKSSNRQMMTDWMNVMNSRNRQELPPREMRRAGEFNLLYQRCHLCSVLCHLSSEAVTPFWPLTPSSVEASLDYTRKLFVVWRNHLFSVSLGYEGCQQETGSPQAECSLNLRIA